MSEDNKRKLGEQLIRCVLDDKLSNDKKLRKMDYIIRLGADVNARHENGFSVLVSAKTIGNDEVIKFLEKRGANCIGCDKEKAEEFFRTASVEEINKVLKVLPDGYELECDVYIDNKGLEKLPNFSNVVVKGMFYCCENPLVTLSGAPKEVIGSFACDDCELISLEGAPRKVKYGFACRYNKLVNLEGAPREVGGDFYANNNPLESLEGAPRVVGGYFDCSHNQLTSLRGAPTKVGKSFDCSNNKLVTLEGAPSEVGDNFCCDNNKLTSLEGGPRIVEGNFYCNGNPLKSYKGKTDNIGGEFIALSIDQINNINGGIGR